MVSVNSSPMPSSKRTAPATSPTPSAPASSPRPLVFGTKAWGEEYCRQVNEAQLERQAEIQAEEATPEFQAERLRRQQAVAAKEGRSLG